MDISIFVSALTEEKTDAGAMIDIIHRKVQ